MSPNDEDRAPAGEGADATLNYDPTEAEGGHTPPTFPSEAESLLRHFRLAPPPAPGATAPSASDELPRIPDYEIECEVGRGGMGVVYKARHVPLNRTVAIKMLPASAHAAPGEVARFLAEAEAVAAIRHPNVVQLHHLGDAGGRPYFVMEFVEGGSLAARLGRGAPLAPREAADLIAAVADGVQAAHDAGIVHRDLKPGNILLSGVESRKVESRKVEGAGSAGSDFTTLRPSDFRPKVTDFGLAKRLASDLTRSQAVMGTPAYMAPEQAGQAKFVGPAADVYALGVVLYECLTGKVPFDSPEGWSVIRQVMEDSPEPPGKLAPGVPRDLELICLKCLEKEPHHRYPSAAALADDLRRFLRGEPVSVRPVGAVARTLRWARRRPAPAALAVLVALLVLVGPPLAVWQQGRLKRRDAVAAEAREKEEEARRAQAAAEQLAAARDLFALQTDFRRRAAVRHVGWTHRTRGDLPRAVALAGGDLGARGDLRSVAADALLAADLVPLEPVAKGFTAAAVATDPNTGRVALGEFKAWGNCGVLLIDPATGAVVRRLKYPTDLIRGNGLLEVVQDGTRALAFSPDGKRLFAGTRGSKVVRFDLDDPRDAPAQTWPASKRPVEQIVVAPGGQVAYALCGWEEPVLAWDADTGKPLHPIRPGTGQWTQSIAVLPSGELLATSGGTLYRWSAAGKLVRTAAHPGCDRLAPAGGSLLLVSAGPRLSACDADSFEPTDRFTDPELRTAAHEENLRAVAVHPSGAFAATAGDNHERAVKVWELASGQLLASVAIPGTGPVALAWSADGRFLLASGDGRLLRWGFAPPAAEAFACVGAWPLEASAALPGGRVAALGRGFNGRRALLVGPAGGRAEEAALPDRGGGGEPGLAGGPGGELAVTLHAPGVTLRGSGRDRAPVKLKAHSPRFGSDGRTLWAVVNSRGVRSFDVKTGEPRGEWANDLGEVLTGLASLDALGAGRDIAAAGGRDGTLYLVDSSCKAVAAFRSPGPNGGDPVLAAAVAPDDSLALAGTRAGLLRVVNVARQEELPAVSAHAGGTTAVALNRGGTLLATGGRDRCVRLWKWTGERFVPLLTASDLPGAVRELHFDRDSDRLIVLLSHARAARVWDLGALRGQLAELKLDW